MATQEDMYRESQKTNAKLEQAVRLLEKTAAGPTTRRAKLEELKKQAEIEGLNKIFIEIGGS